MKRQLKPTKWTNDVIKVQVLLKGGMGKNLEEKI